MLQSRLGRWIFFTLNVQVVLSKDLGALVDGLSRSVEDTAEHVLGDGNLEGVTGELDTGLEGVNTRGSLEDLNDGPPSRHLQHLTGTLGAVREGEVHDLSVLGELDIVQNDQGTIDTRDSPVVWRSQRGKEKEMIQQQQQQKKKKKKKRKKREGLSKREVTWENEKGKRIPSLGWTA